MKKIIYELSQSQFLDVAPLFEQSWAHIALVDSVLEGKRAGRIFVDDVQYPASCLLCEATGNYYVVGDAGAISLRQFIKDTPSEAEVFDRPSFAFFLTGEAWANALIEGHENSMEFFDVRTFKFSKTSVDAIGGLPNLAKDAVVKRIDSELVERIAKELSIHIAYSWGGSEQFLKQGFGFCILINEAIACVAWSFAVSSRYAEIFIDTKEAFRRQGLATLTSLAFIEHCLAQGLIPTWACQSSNVASVAAARKLGFVEGPLQCESNWRPYGANFNSSRGLWTKQVGDPGRSPEITMWWRKEHSPA